MCIATKRHLWVCVPKLALRDLGSCARPQFSSWRHRSQKETAYASLASPLANPPIPFEIRFSHGHGSNYLLSLLCPKCHRTQFFRVFQAVAGATGLPKENRHPHVLKDSLASHLVASRRCHSEAIYALCQIVEFPAEGSGHSKRLFGDDSVGPFNERNEDCRISELRAPSRKVTFRNPTGAGAPSTRKHRNVLGNDFLPQFTE